MSITKDLAMKPVLMVTGALVLGVLIGTLVVAPIRSKRRAKKLATVNKADKPIVKKVA